MSTMTDAQIDQAFMAATSATPKQMALIRTLMAERDVTADALATGLTESTTLDKTAASVLITRLFAAPKKAGAAPVEPGMYVLDESIYRVVNGRNGGHPYAKLLTPDGYAYAPGIVGKLTPADRMTAEAAASYGRRTGTCCVCAATLTDPKSIERGMGPWCAGRI